MTRTILILGAGDIGTALARACAGDGDRVIAVRRRPPDGPPEPGITWVAGDARDPARLPGLPDRADAVVLCAAPGGGASHAETYPPLARAALALARRLGAPTVVYTSSTGVYGERGGGLVTEDTPRRAASPDGRALIEAEDVLLAADDVRVAILRVAGIYGPGRPAYPRYRDASRLPLAGQAVTNFAHRDDIVRALRLVLDRPDAPRVLNCADGTPLTGLEVAEAAARAVGRPWVPPSAFAADAPPPRSNQRVVTDRLRALGWAPRWPSVREGFAALASGVGTRHASG